jgi:hypothetical protein
MKTTLILFFSLICLGLGAQTTRISGQVQDSTGAGLPAVSVVLMTVSDSVMSSFGLSDESGTFQLKARQTGKFLVQYTFLGYTTEWQEVEVSTAGESMQLSPVIMKPSTEVLPYVEISAERSPMRFSRDTLEYNAAAFKVNPGDAVEDLLKQLPGVEVERDGTVKAQGETVQNVLVDGKEFFGKDTRIATKNLPAESVDKVQVYDKKSDMAEFTGIEDGQDEKTINLNLKEGYKSGYFGKADMGYGTDNRYNGRVNVNRFTSTDRLSFIGNLNNINEQNFSIQDYIEFMGGIGAFMSGGGGRVEIDLGGDGGLPPIGGSDQNQGIQSSLAAGLNWSKEIGDKTKLNASYFLNRFQNDLNRSAYRENLSNEGIFVGTEGEEQTSSNLNNRFNATLRHTIDSTQNFILRANGGFSNGLLNSLGNSAASNPSGILLNDGMRDYASDGKNYSFDSRLTYRKRFAKKGRALILGGEGGLTNRERSADLMALNRYYDAMTLTDSILQDQYFGDSGFNYGINASYTEPLGKRQYLEMKASRQNYQNESRKDFYDIGSGNRMLNEDLSNHFRRGYTYDRAGLNYMFNRNAFRLTAGVAYQESRLDNLLIGEDLPFKAQFARFLPSFFSEYEIGNSNRLSLDYTTMFREPSPEQLQPVVNNSDPLNVYIGNPSLKPEYMHELRLGYFLYDQFSFTSLFANLTGMYTQDRITNATSIDSLLRRTTMPINVEREMGLRGSVQFGTPIRPLQLKMKLRLNSNLTQRILFVNELENDVRDLRSSVNFSIENRKKDKFDAEIGVRLSNTQTDWSVNEDLNQQYTNYGSYAGVKYTPVPRWLFDTDFDYTVYSAETFGARTAIPLWQAGITHYFLKERKGRIRLSVYDILGQNQGLTRSSQLNYIEQTQYNVLSRYVMLTLGYNLSGFGNKSDGAIHLNFEN